MVLKYIMNEHNCNTHSCILNGSNSLQAEHRQAEHRQAKHRQAKHRQALEKSSIIYDNFHMKKDVKDMKHFVNTQFKSTKKNLIIN